MKGKKTNLNLITCVMLLFSSLIVSGQTIKPIGRTVNLKGDTITLFSIQSERQIVYQLQIGKYCSNQLKTLELLDSALRSQNLTLKEKNDLMKDQYTDCKNEVYYQQVISERTTVLLKEQKQQTKKEHRKVILWQVIAGSVVIISIAVQAIR